MKDERRYFNEKWWISPYNFNSEVRGRLKFPKRVYVRDSTIREGEETPKVHYSLDDKIKIVEKLEAIGVEDIDCGYVGTVQEHWDIAKAIKERGLKIRTYCHLGSSFSEWNTEIAKISETEIDFLGFGIVLTQWQLDLFAPKQIDGTDIGRVEPEMMISLIPSVLENISDAGVTPILDCVDATRTDMNTLQTAVKTGIESGVQKVILYDTVGACFPEAIKFMVSNIKSVTKNIPLGVHIHDDFGLGTASSLAAVEEGVELIDLVVNKLGDRAGNTSLEEVVTSLEILYGVNTGIKMDQLYELSKLVEKLSGVPIPPNKPVVGENTFLHESELHTMSMVQVDKFWMCFTPYRPELVGQEEQMIFGSTTLHGGAIRMVCESLGLKDYENAIPLILDDLRRTIAEKKYATSKELIATIKKHVDK